jgi:hypothetical protein
MSTVVLPQPSQYAARPYNSLAAVALALTFVTVIGGIVCGHVALSQIRRTGERGRWLALTALVIGYAEVAGIVALFVGLPAFALLLHVAH